MSILSELLTQYYDRQMAEVQKTQEQFSAQAHAYMAAPRHPAHRGIRTSLCIDAGGTSPRMATVELCRELRSRTTRADF